MSVCESEGERWSWVFDGGSKGIGKKMDFGIISVGVLSGKWEEDSFPVEVRVGTLDIHRKS